VKSWGGVLESSYIAHFPPPWFRNYGKRVVKSPKFYFYDFALVTLLMRQPDVYFWRSHDDLEVDLLIVIGGKLQSVEIKLTATPGAPAMSSHSIASLPLPVMKLRGRGSWFAVRKKSEPCPIGMLPCRGNRFQNGCRRDWRSLRANSPSSGKSWDGNLDHLVSGMTTGGTATMPR
jgi:hypothetical protein